MRKKALNRWFYDRFSRCTRNELWIKFHGFPTHNVSWDDASSEWFKSCTLRTKNIIVSYGIWSYGYEKNKPNGIRSIKRGNYEKQ